MTSSDPPSGSAFRWLGHGSVFVPGSPALAVDPWKWRYEDLQADVVLVTSAHVDHCCADDLARATRSGARALAPAGALSVVRTVFGERAAAAAPGDVHTIGEVEVHVLPFVDASTFHAPGDAVTFGVRTPAGSYLFLGASRPHDAHAAFGADVAFIGVGGLIGPGPDEGVEVARAVRAKHAVPVLWGDLHGRYPNAKRFLDGCREAGLSAGVAN